MTSTVLLIGTLDTKGREIAYVKGRIQAMGVKTLVLDAGILGEPLGVKPDIPHDQVARAAGSTLEWLRNAGSRGAAVAEMSKGVREVALGLLAKRRLQGIICLGGADGAVMGASAMNALPIGVPKVLVTPIASGKRHFGTLTGTRDVMVVHSVVDIVGLNPISRAIFDNAAAAMVGMVKNNTAIVGISGRLDTRPQKYVAITMLGNTAKGVLNIKERLAKHNIEAVLFHSNGAGGPAMEELAEAGMFIGVIDYTTDELSDQQFGGFHQGGERRLERVGMLGLPQVVVPGCIDFMVHGPRDEIPARFKNRPVSYQDAESTLVRLSRDEMQQVGQIMAKKLNKSTGPLVVVVPTRGLSMQDVPGGVFWDPDADLAFLQSLLLDLRSGIPVITVEANINDQAFSDRVADEFLNLLGIS
jgi:uncharacterized protein (UPF0261 family)